MVPFRGGTKPRQYARCKRNRFVMKRLKVTETSPVVGVVGVSPTGTGSGLAGRSRTYNEPISSSDDEDSTGAEAPATTPVMTRDTDLPHVETQLCDDVDVKPSPTEDSKMSRFLLQVQILTLPGSLMQHFI
ncbi:hypothetical protein KIN20_015630 [Parelaphostrongylus tenuis]|uniref:Uncharacterized protein n=1 Tax=Parelaphostrongylus tenuis TaxID=148309 RepID=A0AAD5MGC7_PARTN|nr:hypothetical protein KIN20_015630 [Parelaphostrongylus tenuis]